MEAEPPTIKPLMAGHLVELMSDTEVYGWEQVCAFHAVLL